MRCVYYRNLSTVAPRFQFTIYIEQPPSFVICKGTIARQAHSIVRIDFVSVIISAFISSSWAFMIHWRYRTQISNINSTNKGHLAYYSMHCDYVRALLKTYKNDDDLSWYFMIHYFLFSTRTTFYSCTFREHTLNYSSNSGRSGDR